MLQQFVRTDDLDKVFAAANAVMAKEKPTAWTLKAFKYYHIPSPPLGLAGIVIEPTEDLHRLQDETHQTGGGRTVNANVIDILMTWLVNRDREFLQGGATAATKPGTNAFPYLAHQIPSCRWSPTASILSQRRMRSGH